MTLLYPEGFKTALQATDLFLHEANLVDRHSAAHRASSRLRAGSLTSAVSRSLSNSLYVCECMHML